MENALDQRLAKWLDAMNLVNPKSRIFFGSNAVEEHVILILAEHHFARGYFLLGEVCQCAEVDLWKYQNVFRVS